LTSDAEKLERSRDDLEMRIAQLEQNNNALREFVSAASHDMQEPLRKLMTYGDLFRTKCRDTLSELESEYLGKMEKAASRLQNLLKNLLEYSRVSTIKTSFVQVDLNKLLSEVLDDLEGRISETGARFEVERLPVIKADPNQMWQLFQNLIGNSLKYRGDEKPFIRIYSKRLKRSHWRISINDNGIGFDEKYLERIFAPFQRLHGKSSLYEGTGMGLAISKKIVELHGGVITAKSKPGEGSTFMIILPIKHQIQLSLFKQ
jgi:light-regulated signal transduction histidine kinase (bacteriophytochrome)